MYTKGINVKYIDHMGSDERVVQTSRVCTNSQLKDANTIKNVNALMRMGHWSAFEQCYLSYEIEVPIFVARQWMRHHQNYMEKSLRYTVATKGYPRDAIFNQDVFTEYQDLMDMGIAREDARRVLPLDTMTTIQCTVNLRTALNMIGLRMDSHAQEETQTLATYFYYLLKEYFPISVEAYLNYCYQDFNTHINDLAQVVYQLKRVVDDGQDNACLRRFIENGEKRIRTVREYMPDTFSKVEDSTKDK